MGEGAPGTTPAGGRAGGQASAAPSRPAGASARTPSSRPPLLQQSGSHRSAKKGHDNNKVFFVLFGRIRGHECSEEKNKPVVAVTIYLVFGTVTAWRLRGRRDWDRDCSRSLARHLTLRANGRPNSHPNPHPDPNDRQLTAEPRLWWVGRSNGMPATRGPERPHRPHSQAGRPQQQTEPPFSCYRNKTTNTGLHVGHTIL